MNFNNNAKKIFFFYLLTFFFAFFFLEIASRLFVSVITKKFDILKYGYDKNIDLQIRKLSKLDFEIIDNTLLITKKINFNKKNLKKKKSGHMEDQQVILLVEKKILLLGRMN